MRTPSARNGRRTRRGTAAPAPARTRAEAAGGGTFDLAELLTVLTAVRKGDFSARMGVNRTGIAGKVPAGRGRRRLGGVHRLRQRPHP